MCKNSINIYLWCLHNLTVSLVKFMRIILPQLHWKIFFEYNMAVYSGPVCYWHPCQSSSCIKDIFVFKFNFKSLTDEIGGPHLMWMHCEKSSFLALYHLYWAYNYLCWLRFVIVGPRQPCSVFSINKGHPKFIQLSPIQTWLSSLENLPCPSLDSGFGASFSHQLSFLFYISACLIFNLASRSKDDTYN